MPICLRERFSLIKNRLECNRRNGFAWLLPLKPNGKMDFSQLLALPKPQALALLILPKYHEVLELSYPTQKEEVVVN